MTPERKKELDTQYAESVLGKSQEDTRNEWLKYLAVLYKEDGDYQIFLALRANARNAAGKVVTKYIGKLIGDKELYHQIRERGQDKYAKDLNTYGLANIDLSSATYKDFTSDMAFEVLQACKDWETTGKDICDVRSRVWHRFVERVHKLYGLPSVATIRETVGWSSVEEKEMIDSNDFGTKVTAVEKEEWVRKIAAVGDSYESI
jgi:hypothetical protein